MALGADRSQNSALFPLIVCAICFGFASKAWGSVGVISAIAFIGLIVGGRIALSVRVQFFSAAALVGASLQLGPMGIIAARIPISPESELHPFAARVALAGLVIASERLYIRNARGGIYITLLLLLSSLVATGFTRIGPVFMVMVALFVATSLFALRRIDQPGPRFFKLDGRRKGVAVLMFLVAIGIAASLSVAIPMVHRKAMLAFLKMEMGSSTSGISDSILLSGSADISESDEVVLRIRGGTTDYLRGFVFSEYRNDTWTVAIDEQSVNIETRRPGQAPSHAIEIRSAKVQPRFYLPLSASSVATPTGHAMADRMGTLHARSGHSADSVWFLPEKRDNWQVALPTPMDTSIPEKTRKRLSGLLAEWTQKELSELEKLQSIERHFQSDFQYSLKHKRKTSQDPILDFLFENRIGHCEYFASAMALLARASNIPARVVAGYRVSEVNPYGDYAVVRERDAHAWVEAYVPERGWVTFDPTPPSALLERRSPRTPIFAGIVDFLSDYVNRVRGQSLLKKVSGWTVLGVLGIAAAVILLVRRKWRAKNRGAGKRTQDSSLPCFDALVKALAKNGVVRGEAESLEAFAIRVREGGSFAAEASGLIESYARFRYGGECDRKDLEDKIARFVG